MPTFIQEKLEMARKEAAALAVIAEGEEGKVEPQATDESSPTKEEAKKEESTQEKSSEITKEEAIEKESHSEEPSDEVIGKEESPKEEPSKEEDSNERSETPDKSTASSQPSATNTNTTISKEQNSSEEPKLVSETKQETESKRPLPGPVITSAERSKALAQSRLLLQQTVASISEMCQLDAKKDQNYREVMVETSENQKIWKDQSEKKGGYGFFQKKYDSTIEQSDDFKKFMERKVREKEELSNRPKPPPGGGQVADASGSSEGKEGLENGQPIAALVLHLLEKNRSSKSKKDAKKTVKDTQKKLKKTGSLAQGRGKAPENVGNTTSKAEGPKRNRKKRQGGNKKAGKNRSSAAADSNPFPALGPAMILKPGMN